MATSPSDAAVPSDLSHRLGPLERVCLILSQAALLLAVIMIVSEVILRRVFSYSFKSTEELGGYLLVVIFFLSMSVCQSSETFHRVHLVQDRLSERWQLITRLVFDVFSLAVCLILVFYLSRFEALSWRRGDTSLTMLATPLWIPRAVMPVGFAILCYAISKTILAGYRRLVKLSHVPGRP